MRGLLLRLVRALVRLFYRRIEVTGLSHVPREGPVLLVANHANGLVDPMIILTVLSRPVVFVAKSTLWRIPGLRSLLDLLGCVPVVRRHEADGPSGEERNAASLERLAGVLREGDAVLIFPEGRSHSDPHLSGIRTGAARILLLAGASPPVVPIGLWFTKKEEFRSDVLIRIGPPVAPPGEQAVAAWTERIERGLLDVTLNADDWKDHEVVAAVEALYGRSVERDFLDGGEGEGLLDRSFRVRQVLLSARRLLTEREPDAVAQLARRARTFDHLLRRVGFSPAVLDDPPSPGTILWNTVKSLLVVVLGFPIAVLGVVAFWVPYRLSGVVANRIPGAASSRDQIALYKLLAGAVLFPLGLSAEAALAWRAGGALWAASALVLLPLAGIVALRYLEHAEWRERQARELLTLALFPGRLARLRARRDALVAECDRLAAVAAGGRGPT